MNYVTGKVREPLQVESGSGSIADFGVLDSFIKVKGAES